MNASKAVAVTTLSHFNITALYEHDKAIIRITGA